jgi:phosphotransferase system HPr (HPr) family protein
MNGTPLRRIVIVSNPQGLHMRPITAFVERAGKFRSTVYLSKEEGQRINGKSPLALLGLAAEKGTELILEVTGPDEQDALEALAEFLASFRTEEDFESPQTSTS